MASRILEYRQGGEGMIKWSQDNVLIPIVAPGALVPTWVPLSDLPTDPTPETGRSSSDFWENMKNILREALVMKNGRFVHRLIIFCWQRGEAKSFLTCLVQLWKFFNFPKQLIALAANSKEQTKFVHYDVMRDIILNSPNLLGAVGRDGIQVKEIRLKDRAGEVVSVIRSISSFSGIVSNITGYTFSEIFDLRNPKFFYQLDGSIRNMPNALGVIDSTVSTKDHVLHKLYQLARTGKDPSLYFSHRSSPRANYKDFWHPDMTKAQLSSYKLKFPTQEFNQYFKNTWEAGSQRLFSPDIIYASKILGFGGVLGMQKTILKSLRECRKIKQGQEEMEAKGNLRSSTMGGAGFADGRIKEIVSGFQRVSSVYTLGSGEKSEMATRENLAKLTDMYDTDWALLVGIDRSDPLKQGEGARTIITAVAKGLPGSRSNPEMMYHLGAKSYIYFLLCLTHVVSARIDDIKLELAAVHAEFDGIETACGERWGLWDLGTWCEENDILFTPVQPTQDRQKEAFSELLQVYRAGLFKTPPVHVVGAKGKDILVEEASYFNYNVPTKSYGSPEKRDRRGVQDDAIYSLGWGIWGGRHLTIEDFRPRTSELVFGEYFKESVIGKY